MAEQEKSAFCEKCDEVVDVLFVSVGTRGIEEPRCSSCGSELQSDKLMEGKRHGLSDVVFIAGYPEDKATLLKKSLLDANVATKVVYCKSGEDLIVRLVKAIRYKQPPRLVILETNMPIMNGVNSALCIRAIEKGLGFKENIHILFFTTKELDEVFKKAIKFLKPAKYVPMERSIGPKAFSERVVKMADVLAREHW